MALKSSIALLVGAFALGGAWLLKVRQPPPPRTPPDTMIAEPLNNGATNQSTASTQTVSSESLLAERVLASYESLERLSIRIESTYYWWHSDHAGLGLKLDDFPPRGEAVSRTAEVASVEVDATPQLQHATLKGPSTLGSTPKPFLEFQFADSVYIEKNVKSGEVYRYSDQRQISKTSTDSRFLCETAMWVPPLVGKQTHQGRRFSEFVRRGNILGERIDAVGALCTVVLVTSPDEYNYFWINGDYLVPDQA